METTKKLTDAQILENVIKIKQLTRNGFSKKCQYKSAMSVYNVLDGKHPMTEDMKTRIAVIFPDISYSYLQTGEGSIIKTAPDKFNVIEDEMNEAPQSQSQGTLAEFATIPATLLRIEELLKELLNK